MSTTTGDVVKRCDVCGWPMTFSGCGPGYCIEKGKSELQQLRRETKHLRDDRDRLADIVGKDAYHVALVALVARLERESDHGDDRCPGLDFAVTIAKKALAEAEPPK